MNMPPNKSNYYQNRRKSTVNNYSSSANLASYHSGSKSFTQTEEEPSKGNILVEESVNTYESIDTLAQVNLY